MRPIARQEILDYVEQNIHIFHEARFACLQNLKLKKVLSRKNPYLLKAKNIDASSLVKTIVDAYLSSSEEGIFGNFLEGLAIFVSERTLEGRKSTAEGIDLEFDRDGVRYLISVKSGPSWGNSSQINKMIDNFNKAKRILNTSSSTRNVIAINGCCYGRDSKPDKGSYTKLCGQRFWEFISGDENLYVDIIESLGYGAKEYDDQFQLEYPKVLERFTTDFLQNYCDRQGEIDWAKIVELNSSKETGRRRSQ